MFVYIWSELTEEASQTRWCKLAVGSDTRTQTYTLEA